MQVHPGDPGVHVHLGQAPARGWRGQRRLQDEHDLEQRVAAGISSLSQGRHDVLDRDVGVCQRLERRLPDARENLPERASAREPRPQHQCIEEEADDTVQFGTVAARGHGPDQDVLLACIAVEQDV